MGQVIRLRPDDRPCVLVKAIGKDLAFEVEFADGDCFEFLVDREELEETIADVK